MNTIQVTKIQPESNDKITVNYTETEVLRFIEKAKSTDELNESIIKQIHVIRDNRNAVRDFFSEGQWDDGEFSASKEDVNELLQSIGANRLTSKYRGTYTVTGTFSVDAEDANDAEALFTDNVDISFYDGDIDVDQVEVLDVEEDN
jgi:GH25 family lysozyme M1 (1,4-beta-N-acetylmuramidase)